MDREASVEGLAHWLGETVREVGSITREQAISLMRARGASELSALLALAHAFEHNLVGGDPRAIERIGSKREEAPRSSKRARDAAPCVVVVEDDAAVRDAVSEALEAEGYRVYSAGDGSEALRVLAQIPTPSLILLDLMMPVMDGWELLARLRRDTRLGGVPVAIVSGTNEHRPPEMRFIKKPINPVSLIEAVESLRGPART